MRKAKAIYSELAVAMESAVMHFWQSERQAQGWESFIVGKNGRASLMT